MVGCYYHMTTTYGCMSCSMKKRDLRPSPVIIYNGSTYEWLPKIEDLPGIQHQNAFLDEDYAHINWDKPPKIITNDKILIDRSTKWIKEGNKLKKDLLKAIGDNTTEGIKLRNAYENIINLFKKGAE